LAARVEIASQPENNKQQNNNNNNKERRNAVKPRGGMTTAEPVHPLIRFFPLDHLLDFPYPNANPIQTFPSINQTFINHLDLSSLSSHTRQGFHAHTHIRFFNHKDTKGPLSLTTTQPHDNLNIRTLDYPHL
jgi:hypothetical protein